MFQFRIFAYTFVAYNREEWIKSFLNQLLKITFFSCFQSRYIRTLTFDIILSTAFGVQSECQTNPDDPTMVQARDALRFGPVALTIIGLGLLLPYGTKMLKLLSPWLFKNFEGIRNVADQVIRTSKEKAEGTEKVYICCNSVAYSML